MSPPSTGAPDDTLQERLRDEIRSLSRFNRMHFWLITCGSWWLLGILALYLTGGFLMGWTDAYKILVGLTPPSDVPYSGYGYLLSVTGWLIIPAFVGATAGYMVTWQVNKRRSRDIEDILAEMESAAGGPGSPPPVGGSA
ncbi:DUF6313 family protein [Streptomyces scabichelini]|uniref:DUF6313 family protein n=1 Tax=Streptomyces scabichelini TaxID=2711217 RepID=UPI003B97AD5C